jgi:hypothetical protein
MLCAVCTVHKETRRVGFLVEPQNQGRQVSQFGPQTGGYGLVIWASKSLQRFLSLGLKIKWATVCRLHHKTNKRRMA